MEFHQIMERYRDQLKTIADIDTLHTLKKNLQDQVTDPALDWKGRMEIYKKVQLVIERIEEIRSEMI